MNKIGELYDTLKKANRGKEASYSIHKKLDYHDNDITNLYDYLLMNSELKQKKEILDCGCGVGFGAMLLAKKLGANVTGISISSTEIESAKANLQSQGNLSNVIFECKSFDDLRYNKYDAIIAIESLKHSPQLSKTLDSIKNALKPGGNVYIIEDVIVKSSNSLAERKLKSDWVLSKLYTEKEYTGFSNEFEWTTFDLTPMMNKPSKLEVAAKIFGTEIKTGIDSILGHSNSAASIFRGGFYQEWLYANKTLNYKMLIGKKQ
jgi:cyclopropane fatty-acyl-phospholipid synthase-like methyltransferase